MKIALFIILLNIISLALCYTSYSGARLVLNNTFIQTVTNQLFPKIFSMLNSPITQPNGIFHSF